MSQVDELERLEGMLKRGVITPDEFERQKAAILATSQPQQKINKKSGCLTTVLWLFGIGIFCVFMLRWAGSTAETSGTSNPYPVESPPPTNTAAMHLNIIKASWNDGDISIGEHSFTITNSSGETYYDPEIKFTYYGESGTEIDSETKVIHVTVPPNGKKRVSEYNTGFIPQDAKSASVIIVSAQKK